MTIEEFIPAVMREASEAGLETTTIYIRGNEVTFNFVQKAKRDKFGGCCFGNFEEVEYIGGGIAKHVSITAAKIAAEVSPPGWKC